MICRCGHQEHAHVARVVDGEVVDRLWCGVDGCPCSHYELRQAA